MAFLLRSPLVAGLGTALAVAVVLAGAQSAEAAAPLKVTFPVHITYEIEDLTEICGFEVWFSMDGTFKGTVFTNRSGTITGEFDSQPDTRITFNSPESGKSFGYMFSTTFHNKYPDGVDPGDQVIATATGFVEKLPGLAPFAGRMYFPDGEVLFVDDGVPYVDYGEPSSFTGRETDFDAADAAICGELAP